MTRVLKIAKPGKSVDTATDDELVFSSEFNTLKIAHSGNPVASGSYYHNLGYAPAFIVNNPSFTDATRWGFVGQYPYPSPFEAGFYIDNTDFYYFDACNYFLIYQETITI